MFSALSPSISLILSLISSAALIVKVLTRILFASNPFSTRYSTFSVKTLVFPVPGPAIIKRGPSIYSTAFFCCLFKISEIRIVSLNINFNCILIQYKILNFINIPFI